ncbi:MAG: hypothetical protein HYV35_00695 [Lentisphaerae bacterium]|nr:hypothetical protein [Lentisphaerota bacterium]
MRRINGTVKTYFWKNGWLGILLALVMLWSLPVPAWAQVGSSISADGSAPNNNAMLDVQSPATGDGKGILIPRVTANQRTTANAALAGGLLDNSGNLRGGAAQGLIVYQTDGVQGLYFNTSQSTIPAWAYLGDVAGLLASNVWAAAGSTTNYLPRTGGTMSGPINMGAQIVSNVAHVDFNADSVSVGRGANGASSGAAVGFGANGYNESVALGNSANGAAEGAAVGFSANANFSGAAMGWNANGFSNGVAMGSAASGVSNGVAIGWSANGPDYGVAIARMANGASYGAAVGYLANGAINGAAVGRQANGYDNGAAVGYLANGSDYGAAVGLDANGNNFGAAVGRDANGADFGAAVGRNANGYTYGAAVGNMANGTNYGAAVGMTSYGYNSGAAVGFLAYGYNYGVAVGYYPYGYNYGVAMGAYANGAQTNVAIGAYATAKGGLNRIAIGYHATNELDNTAVIRGTLYLDGGTSNIYYRTPFGDGSWSNKAFEIDHPLDPENKILRHYCLEGPQVWNVYAGNAQLVNGQAEVQLPDYYSALNLVGSEIYSLTPIGGRADIWIQKEVENERFLIRGEKDIKVSWTIKVLRNDPGCLEDLRRRPVEQLKRELETGN